MASQQNDQSRAPASQARPQLTPTQLQQLADKVYRLLLADLRQELSRGAQRSRRRKE
jgi:hypothetical protein